MITPGKHYEFDRIVNRSHIGSLKEALIPQGWASPELPSFDGAEMDFPTAPSILQKMHELVDNGLFGYTLADDSYRRHVCWWMKEVRSWDIRPEWIVPSPGTIHSVATAIRLLTQEGDSVLVQSPEYPRYAQAILRLGRQVLTSPLLRRNGRYEMDWEQLALQMDKTKLMVLCNPHNPTGRVWTPDECRRLMQLADMHGVKIISDEIFAEVVWDEHKTTPCGHMTITSLGKTFNFTGVNHANVIIPDEELRERWICQRDADHFGSIDPWVYASIQGAYSPEGLDWIKAMLAYVDENRRMLLNRKIPHLTVTRPEGTYVIWLLLSGFNTEDEQMQFLREKAGIIATPGSEYGQSGWFRMNMATPHRFWQQAIENLERALQSKS